MAEKTARERAAGILGPGKLRQLEEAGLEVVETVACGAEDEGYVCDLPRGHTQRDHECSQTGRTWPGEWRGPRLQYLVICMACETMDLLRERPDDCPWADHGPEYDPGDPEDLEVLTVMIVDDLPGEGRTLRTRVCSMGALRFEHPSDEYCAICCPSYAGSSGKEAQ